MTDSFDDAPPGETTYSQARATNEVIKVKKARVQLENLKAEHIDIQQAMEHARQLFAHSRSLWLSQIPDLTKALAKRLNKPQKTLRPIVKARMDNHIETLSEFRF